MDLNIKIYDMKGVEPIEESSGGSGENPPIEPPIEPPATADYTGWVKTTCTKEELLTLPKINILGQRELVKIHLAPEDSTKLYYLYFKEDNDAIFGVLSKAMWLEMVNTIEEDYDPVYVGHVFVGVLDGSDTIEASNLTYFDMQREYIFVCMEAYVQGIDKSGCRDILDPICNLEIVTVQNPYKENVEQSVYKITLKPEFFEKIETEDRVLYVINKDLIFDALAVVIGDEDFVARMKLNKYYGKPLNDFSTEASYGGLGGVKWHYADIDFNS